VVRVKTGPTRRKRHKKVLARTKGYRKTKSKLYKVAHEAMLHAGQYAFAGRKLKKRDMRRLWIIRINAGLSKLGISYSKFMASLKKARIELDRKILADLAVSDPDIFKKIVEAAKKEVKGNSNQT
jgi:large subunit ribosomal protein L20